MIEFADEHTSIFGITRSGKTYGALHSLNKLTEPVLYWNTNWEEKSIPMGWIKADGSNSIKQIISTLGAKKKINYLPNGDLEIANKELALVIDSLFKNKANCRLVVDEVHLYKKEGLKKLIQVATTGLSKGVKGVWISQRGANVDNTLITQSNRFVFFKTNLEEQYWERNYGIPLGEINRRIVKAGQYAFCEYDLEKIIGAKRV